MSRYFGSKLTKIGYSLYDVTVVQAPLGSIEHRADVDPFVEICERKVYPIFVSPMSSVTDEKNYKIWIEHKLTPVVPRSIKQNITFRSTNHIIITFKTSSIIKHKPTSYIFTSRSIMSSFITS